MMQNMLYCINNQNSRRFLSSNVDKIMFNKSLRQYNRSKVDLQITRKIKFPTGSPPPPAIGFGPIPEATTKSRDEATSLSKVFVKERQRNNLPPFQSVTKSFRFQAFTLKRFMPFSNRAVFIIAFI